MLDLNSDEEEVDLAYDDVLQMVPSPKSSSTSRVDDGVPYFDL